MANAIFNAKITLSNAAPTAEPDEFDIEADINDAEGLFNGLNVSVGDILILDTAGAESGTVSKYKILSISDQDFGTITAKIQYDDIGSPIDAAGAIGIPGMICSPSAEDALPWLPAIDTQGLPAKLLVFARNIIDRQKIDGNLGGGGGGSSNIKSKIIGAAVAAGKPISLRPDGKIIQTDSDGVNARNFIGVSLTSGADDGDPINVQLVGANLVGVLTGLGFAPGSDIFMDQTSGGYTDDPDAALTGDDDDLFKLGVADCGDGSASASATDLILLPEVIARA